MLCLSRKIVQRVIVKCGEVSAEIFVKEIGRSNVVLGFIGQKDKILFVRGEKVIPDKNIESRASKPRNFSL